MLAMVVLERQVRLPLLARLIPMSYSHWPAYYALVVVVAGAVFYLLWMLAITRLLRSSTRRDAASTDAPEGLARRDAASSLENPAEAHLGEVLLIGVALLLPYALIPSPAWIAVSLLLAVVICLYDLRDLRRMLAVPAEDLDEHRMPADQAQPLRQLAAQHGLERLNLIVAPSAADEGDGKGRGSDAPAWAQFIPTRGQVTFVFTRPLLKLLDPPGLRAVFAHELAHWRLKHSRKTVLAHMLARLACVVFVAQALGWILLLGPTVCPQFSFHPGDPLPPSSRHVETAVMIPTALLLWALASMAASLLLRAYMRDQELAAHAWAARAVGDAAAYAETLRRVAEHNGYQEPTPLGRLLDESPALDEVTAVLTRTR